MKWPALSSSRRCDLVTRPYAVQVGCRTDVGRAYCRWIPSPHPALDRFLSRGLLVFSRIFSGRSLHMVLLRPDTGSAHFLHQCSRSSANGRNAGRHGRGHDDKSFSLPDFDSGSLSAVQRTGGSRRCLPYEPENSSRITPEDLPAGPRTRSHWGFSCSPLSQKWTTCHEHNGVWRGFAWPGQRRKGHMEPGRQSRLL